MTPRLSICIATFNRARYLEQTLSNIVAQVEPDIEIVIVDGASTDDTEEVVRAMQKSSGCIRYERQSTNGGVDRDFDRAVEIARGAWCWLFSDDDLMKPGAIQRVLERLQADCDAVIVNAEVRDENLRNVLRPVRMDIDRNRVYQRHELDKLVVDVADYITFIGAVVVRRHLWMERERERYFGSLFIHVGILFQSAIPRPVFVIAEPLIIIRYGNAMWTSRAFEIWMFKWPSLIWSFEHLEEDTRKLLVSQRPWYRSGELIRYRAIGAYDLDDYRRLIQKTDAPRYRKWQARVLAVFPGTILNLLVHLTVRVLRGRYSSTAIEIRASRFYWGRFLGRNNDSLQS